MYIVIHILLIEPMSLHVRLYGLLYMTHPCRSLFDRCIVFGCIEPEDGTTKRYGLQLGCYGDGQSRHICIDLHPEITAHRTPAGDYLVYSHVLLLHVLYDDPGTIGYTLEKCPVHMCSCVSQR